MELKPFVLPVEIRAAERHGAVDVYLPDDHAQPDDHAHDQPRPVILFVHGGPLPEAFTPRPREWSDFRSYGSLAAARGVVGATVDHRLYSPAAYATAADDVRDAVELLRADPRVDGDRVALWFFSGGGLLSADWLREPPAWLRCLALTYPLLEAFEGWPVEERFRPVEVVAQAGELPIVLTRVGREDPALAVHVERFVEAAAKSPLQIVDVPDGQHAFDTRDDTDESRAAITKALDLVLAHLT